MMGEGLAAFRAMGAQVYLEQLLTLLGEAYAALGNSGAAQAARAEAAALGHDTQARPGPVTRHYRPAPRAPSSRYRPPISRG